MTTENGKRVVVVGAGGNIGSHLVPHLGRMAAVGGVLLIDQDRYEEKNLQSQDIVPADVGRPKAEVQAERLRRINPQLRVEAIAEPVENVPLGKLRADLILGCLDRRGARRYVGEAAWHRGIPYIDAGVRAGELLARVSLYFPQPGAPCLQCAWDRRHYDSQEQGYGCAAAPTNAPSSLGALAAALEAMECEKLLGGPPDPAGAGREVLVNARSHTILVKRVTRNYSCLFDHQVLEVERLASGPSELSLGKAFRLAAGISQGYANFSLRVGEGSRFVRKLTCASCGAEKALFHLLHRLSGEQETCPKCGKTMVAAGFDLCEKIEARDLDLGLFEQPLAAFGFQPTEVFTISGPTGEKHYEIGCGEGYGTTGGQAAKPADGNGQ